MRRVAAGLAFGAALLATAGAAEQSAMKATAPDKMMSPADQAKMRECEGKAAAQNVPMDRRAKFVMDCMTAKPSR